MKEQLVAHIRRWEEEHGTATEVFHRKAFHKNAHTSEHSSEGLYIPLGGVVAERAQARGEETFHVLADCHGGQIPKTGQGGGGTCTTWLGGAAVGPVTPGAGGCAATRGRHFRPLSARSLAPRTLHRGGPP